MFLNIYIIKVQNQIELSILEFFDEVFKKIEEVF